ncbi:MAG: thrombospondin type 3 repeat-containing protein [Bacteroidales bacterium]|jgi:outer membrane protein OmpA-like peptidoglycan-associated protein
MKRKILVLATVLLLGISASNAQNADKRWALGAHFGFLEYKGDYANGFYTFKPNFALGGSVARYLNPSFDLLLHLYYGETQSANARIRTTMPAFLNFHAKMSNLSLQFKYKLNNGYMLKESAIFAPFFLGGVGVNAAMSSGTDKNNLVFTNQKFLSPALKFGVGINLAVSRSISVIIQSVLMTPAIDKIDGWYPNVNVNRNPDYFMENSIGLYILFGKARDKDSDGDGVFDKEDQCPDTPASAPVDMNGCPLDTDKDGILDYEDECPNVAGLKEFAGCPDTDGDGIQDKLDECPTVFGTAALKGCPEPDADSDGDKVLDKNDLCPNTPAGVQIDVNGCPFDADKDGIADYEDECPNVAGLKEFKGCPDTDGDGIQDKFDECPTVFGLAAFKGCPDSKSDADGDGVPDDNDRCANTPKGFKVDASGCPVDSDRDGIADSEDACPDIAGEVELKGCPYDIQGIIAKYNLSMQPVYFDNASFKLKPQGIDNLDNLAKALSKHNGFGIELAGYCDNKGNEEYNIKLSENRVNTVKRFLESKGIPENRIRIKFFGESNPAENNDLETALRLNRRVEYHLFEVGK